MPRIPGCGSLSLQMLCNKIRPFSAEKVDINVAAKVNTEVEIKVNTC
jgi:hypothetical protein